MSKAKTLQEINQEYFQTAAMLGDLIWKVDKFEGHDLGPGQIGNLKRKLQKIDKEMDEFQKEQAREQERIQKANAEKLTNAKANGAIPPTSQPEAAQ